MTAADCNGSTDAAAVVVVVVSRPVVAQHRVSRCIALLAVLTLCAVATAGGNGRCRGCHQKHKWDHCACGGKNRMKTILNLAPDMSEKPRLMGKRGLWIKSPFTEHKSTFFFYLLVSVRLRECAHRCKVCRGTMEQHAHILLIHFMLS